MFDWITWSIWFLGFIILVIWVWLPIREFMELREARKRQQDAGETAP